MSNQTEFSQRGNSKAIKTIAAIVAVCAGLIGIGGAAKAWFILPYRIDQHDAAITSIRQEYKDVSSEQRQQREILIRIEERLKRKE